MYLPLGSFSPNIKLGMVSASRDCFPRELAEKRFRSLVKRGEEAGMDLFVPKGECCVIETKEQALQAADQLKEAGCDGAVLFLGNFSPEIEDAAFVKAFDKTVMVMAAAEESRDTLKNHRGDALCGLLSAMMAIRKRGLTQRAHLPQDPIVDTKTGCLRMNDFIRILKIVKGIGNAAIGLFGPRPRDFETCNYNLASIASIGVEVEEMGFFDLANRVKSLKENRAGVNQEIKAMFPSAPDGEFLDRLSAYETALLQFREEKKLSGMTTQCWTEQEEDLKHVPCSINARLASMGCPVACENDAYSLIAELMGQYASDSSVTILDINHSIPQDLSPLLKNYPIEDLTGFFHCGNTDPRRLKNPEMKHQVIMKRLMEPDKEPDITRGTVEGQISASPITLIQVHGKGDGLIAYLAEGQFLDLDPNTFGCTGTAHIPGFRRFYRHVLLGRFHHHTAVAFEHCGAVLYDALKLLGVKKIYTPNSANTPYGEENMFPY